MENGIRTSRKMKGGLSSRTSETTCATTVVLSVRCCTPSFLNQACRKSIHMKRIVHELGKAFTCVYKETLYIQQGWYSLLGTYPYPLIFSTLMRIAGFGYRAASRPLLSSKHGKHARRYAIVRLHMLAKDYGLHTSLSIVHSRVIPPVLARSDQE